MIYTSYEMIQDCRAGKPAGWSFFTGELQASGRAVWPRITGAGRYRQVLAQRARHSLATIQPMPERHFMAELRQKVLAVPSGAAAGIDLESADPGLAPLTVVEKKAVWLETMRYGAERPARMLRMDPGTVGKIRDKAADLLRAAQDRWSRTMLQDNGTALGRAAAAQATGRLHLPPKALLDIIDGRSTWSKREEMERHITACWHCVDHFCRLHEVCDLLR